MVFKPEYDKYLEWLRHSGKTNMLGAVKFLLAEFPELDSSMAARVLMRWLANTTGRKEGVDGRL